jgi:nicotinate-nucleotide--dimethylbenzimidazole phosphoribosyltransferase
MALCLESIWGHLDGLTKPPRSLGRLEELAARVCLIQQTLAPKTTPRRLVIFAADHGVTKAGVTLWPTEVTGHMVRGICAGSAASTVFARQSATQVVLVNVGTIEEPIADAHGQCAQICYRSRRISAGTRNMAAEPAMSAAEFAAAWQIGVDEARAAQTDGMSLVIAGEMGIGNTTSTACLAMLLADVSLREAVGRGAGATDAILERKREVVQQAVDRARGIEGGRSQTAIASVAGLEIVAMAGFYAEAASIGLTVILDGAVAGVAALIAEQQAPGTADRLLAAHLSAEPSHAAVLKHLGLSPFSDWNLRLGEGTGALLLLPLLDAAVAMTSQMARLDDLGITPKVSA